MSQSFRVQVGNDAGRHAAEFSMLFQEYHNVARVIRQAVSTRDVRFINNVASETV